MSKFFDDTMQGLLEAVAIDKGGIGLIEKKICHRQHYILLIKKKN